MTRAARLRRALLTLRAAGGWSGPCAIGCCGAVAQVILLASRAQNQRQVLHEVAAVSLLLGIPLVTCCVRVAPWVGSAAVSGGSGGLGMLLGGLLDRSLALPGACACHALHATFASFAVLNWMTALMMLACIPTCLLSPSACGRSQILRPWVTHAVCAAGMWLGMLAGGHWLVSRMSSTAFEPFAAMHIGMLAGMIGGSAITHLLVCEQRPRDRVPAARAQRAVSARSSS